MTQHNKKDVVCSFCSISEEKEPTRVFLKSILRSAWICSSCVAILNNYNIGYYMGKVKALTEQMEIATSVILK